MIKIVMLVDVTSFKCIIYTNLIVPGLILIGGNKCITKSNYYRGQCAVSRVPRSLPPGTRIATTALNPRRLFLHILWLQSPVFFIKKRRMT